MSKRVVVCAAIRWNDTIVLGARHFDSRMHSTLREMGRTLPPSPSMWQQGFIDQFGVFLTREEALAVAESAGQVKANKTRPYDKLFSEDLY